MSTRSSSRKSTVCFNSCTLLSYVKSVTCGSEELSQVLYAQGRLCAHLYAQVNRTSNSLMFFLKSKRLSHQSVPQMWVSSYITCAADALLQTALTSGARARQIISPRCARVAGDNVED